MHQTLTVVFAAVVSTFMLGCALSGGCKVTCGWNGPNCSIHYADTCPVDSGLCVIRGNDCAQTVDCASFTDEDDCNSQPQCSALKDCG